MSDDPFKTKLEVPKKTESTRPEIDLSRFPIPEEDDKFKDATTDELFGALILRIKKEKAKAMLSKAYDQFDEIAKRTNANFAMSVAIEALQEIGDGQVVAAHAIENQDSSPVD
jgi:ribosomal protein S7